MSDSHSSRPPPANAGSPPVTRDTGRRRGAPSIPGAVVQPALVSLITVLVVSPQLLGGVFPWSIAVICVLAGIAGILGSRQIEIFSNRRGAASLLDWMMVIALAWTCVQLIPLPSSWVALLVPESADAWQSNALLYGRAPRSWIPMSLDPGATRLEMAKGTAIVAIFLTARLFAASHQRRRVLEAVAASAITMALVAFGHKLAGVSSVFGIYEPVYASTRLLAPLMNENHLGGFMAMATPIAVGLAFDADTLERRAGWMLGAGLCALAGILSFSRGGMLALAIGVTIFAAVYAMRLGHSRRSVDRSRTLPILTVGALAIILIAVGLDGSDLARELRQRHNIAPKFQAAVAALPLIASHPITGVGRGAFSAAFVQQQGSDKRFFQPENLLVQWTSEWGLPVALALLGIIIWSIGRGFRLRRSHAHLGGLAGLVAIGAQQFVDFSLELLGVAVVASATLGAVADSVRVPRNVSLRKLCFFVSCASLLGAALALSFHGRDVFTLEMRARAALEQDDQQEARELVRSGLWAHPSEPIFALTGAEIAVREGDPAAGRWINRAQALAPLWSAPHLLAARWLFSMGELDQALIEIREAEALRPGSARSTICSLLRDRQDPAIALRASPAGSSGAMFLDRAAPCVPLQSPVGIAIDAAARERDPDLPGPATRQARRLLADGRPLEAVDVLLGVPERGVEGQRLLAEAYLRADDPRSASHAIASLLNLKDTPGTVLRTAASVYVEMGDDANLRRVATRLRGQTGGKAVRLAEVESFLGHLYESHLRYALALKAYEDSNRAHESREALIAIARVAETMGNRERALLTYRRLCRSDGGKGAACASADELAKPAGHWR